MVPVLVKVAMHHICSAGRPSALGQQSASKPNLATIKYLNIYFFLVFQNKLAKIFKVACESRQFRNPDFFKYLIILKFSDLHMEDHMV